MIVVDANILAYAILEDAHSPMAQQVRLVDGDWVSAGLWVYEFENILAMALRSGNWGHEQASMALENARSQLNRAQDPKPSTVFEVVHRHKITAYDAQYVALAMELGVPLVTEDKELLRKFPGRAVSMEGFLENSGRVGLQEPAKKYRVGRKQTKR